jgi:hypothetical protein
MSRHCTTGCRHVGRCKLRHALGKNSPGKGSHHEPACCVIPSSQASWPGQLGLVASFSQATSLFGKCGQPSHRDAISLMAAHMMIKSASMTTPANTTGPSLSSKKPTCTTGPSGLDSEANLGGAQGSTPAASDDCCSQLCIASSRAAFPTLAARAPESASSRTRCREPYSCAPASCVCTRSCCRM